jgi:predicted porin
MNRKLLVLAVGAALALPLAAQAAPTVYGLLNLSVDNLNSSGNDLTLGVNKVNQYKVTSNSSRLGVAGEENLGNGLAAVYMAEWGVDGSMAGTGLVGRNRFVGLQSQFGTVKLGAFDSPLKEARGPVDVFYDMTYTDVGNYVNGQNRMDHVIGYVSPKIADAIVVKVVIQPGQNTPKTGSVHKENGLADAISASVTYEANGLYLALAGDNDVTGGAGMAIPFTPSSTTPTNGHNTIRLAAGYTVAGLKLGAMLQSSDLAHVDTTAIKDDQMSGLLSAAYSLDEKNVIKGQIVRSQDKGLVSQKQTVTFFGLGFDHNFTKATKVYAQVAEARYTYDFGTSTKQNVSVISLGMQTMF